MALVRIVETGEVLTETQAIGSLLREHGLDYERWDTTRLPQFVQAQEALEQPEKDAILATYREELDRLIAEKGYRTADVVVLSPNTPNLDALLDKFNKEHYHTEDEVRFVVDGEGIFFIRGKDEKVYEVTVHAADLLIVPTGTYHWFDLTPSRRIKCVRVFQSTEGWQAIFREEAAASRG